MKNRILLKHANGRSVFVRVGFSWAAFIFGPLWALAKRQWLLFLMLTLTLIPLNLILDIAESTKNLSFVVFGYVLVIGYMIVCGVYGNRWLKRSLERKGYVNESSV